MLPPDSHHPLTEYEQMPDTSGDDVFIFPASFAQKRLWFLDRWEPGVYNIPLSVGLVGQMNLQAMEQALRDVVQRHEALRTTFKMIDGNLAQIIAPHTSFRMPLVELQDFSPDIRLIKMRRLVKEDLRKPFDLLNGPLIRATMLKLEEHYHAMLLTMHHIVSDAWSMEIFFREVTTLYTAYATGQPYALPELPIQYVDYAAWQQEWLQGEVQEKLMSYWSQQLAHVPVLQLPLDHPRPVTQSFRGSARTIVLPNELSRSLRALSKREHVTLFMVLLAAFKTLLFRYTGQSDIVVGTPIAGRNDRKLEGLIGCFINTLALRTDLSGNPTFRELLLRVREVALDAYAHQDLPFEKLVEELEPDRDLSRNPLTQVMFALQNIPRGQVSMFGLTLTPLKLDSETSMLKADTRQLSMQQNLFVDDEPALFDLDLTMWEKGDELLGELKFNTDIFDVSTIDRLQSHFITLLEAIVTDAGQCIADLPLLSASEYQQQIVEWNATQKSFPLDQSYCQLFEAQVARTPDAVAVRCEGEQLTYRELQERAGWLAGHLSACGVGPESLVALLADRSLAFLTAMLAVFKAGGAYLPLDPHHPVARLRQVLTHSGCSLILSTRTFAASLEEVCGQIAVADRPQLLMLEDVQSIALQEKQTATRPLLPHQLAYVIYTSGSTGAPKGVMVEQEGMLNHLYAKIEALHLTASDRVAQTASQCFDISVWQFLAALLVGGQVHILPDDVAHDPARLLDQVERRQLSIVETVPSLLRAIIEIEEASGITSADLGGLRWMIPTGEALPPELCRRWLRLYPTVPLLNAYGPTECSDDVTHYEIDEPPAETVVVTPIGRAVPNLQLYVLDKGLRPVPIGVSGELYVGGIGVGRGYVHDPLRTAEAFVPDPFSAVPGSRLYRTGDLARYGAPGELEFLGRMDHQVKLRGYRIELGEIEAALNQHPCVRDCVVLAREDIPGNQRLVAYIVPAQEQALLLEELQRSLKETLPEYMVPSAFVMLDALPLTPNGKLDRRALPVPNQLLLTSDAEYVAPRTSIEKKLAAIWSEILGVQQIGIHDDFFALGGHSLLTVRLITQIEKQFRKRLPLEAIFQGRTIESLAELLRHSTAVSPWSPVVDASVPSVDLRAEAVLDLSICPEIWPGDLTAEPTAIFLTGATGFLGTFLLAELLNQTKADIYCLVRAANEEEGKKKLHSVLKAASLWQPAFDSRIKAVAGDLSLPLFGLSATDFDELSRKLDVIYHNGAMVNTIYPYQELKATNVFGTQEIIRLTAQSKVKRLHYISTLSVFAHKGSERVLHIREQEAIDEYAEHLRGGYDQSKWVAEKLVTIARSRGLPVVIYRPGRITGHSQTGVWRPDDLLCRMIKGCIQLGSSPVLIFDEKMEMTPVDYVSRAIVALSRRKASFGQAFHLFNPAQMSVKDMVIWANDSGYPLQQLPYNVWLEQLNSTLDSGVENSLAPVAALLFPIREMDEVELVQPTEIVFDIRNASVGLSGTPVRCPPGDARLFKTYLSYMVQSGFLPAPKAGIAF
jgi:amino acid adenylation domain-containing protein/thioester reductase-like protein